MNTSGRIGEHRSLAVFAILALLVLVLPLLMGNRTAETLALSGLVLVSGALLLAVAGWILPFPGHRMPPLPASWQVFALVITAMVVLQILPVPLLARMFGAYPEALWSGELVPGQWSPDPNATLRAWATFVALAAVAWGAASLRTQHRGLLWLVIVIAALFQALYGLISHAANSETIFGIWARNTPDFVHGSFSNRNLFAGYLALTWPMTVAIWWRHSTPGIKRLPFELRVAGSVICGAIVGAALLGSASRLGSAAGVGGMLAALVLWTRYRSRLSRVAIWPIYLTAFGALIAATWYGLTPLAERLAVTSVEEGRFEVYALMLSELKPQWWLTGVGLGGFEAVFRQIQPADMSGWYDYAHNDLLQWLLEMGVIGAALLVAVGVSLWRQARLARETIPLYAGLTAQALVALGDFSWHIPATQVVLAVYLGVLLKPNDPPDDQRTRRKARETRDQISGQEVKLTPV